MLSTVLIFAAGVLVLSLLLAARLLDAYAWRRALVAFQLHLPGGLAVENVAAWLATIQAMTHPGRFALLPLPPVCLEVVSTARGIQYFVLVPEKQAPRLLSGLRASLPGARIAEAPEYIRRRPVCRVAAELTMSSQTRPLGVERAEAVSAALLASLQPVVGDSEIRMQWIFTSAGTPWPVPTSSASRDASPAWSWESTVPGDAEAVQAARAKIRDPLLLATARVGVAAPNKAEAYALFGRVWNNLHGLNAPGVRLRRRILPAGLVAERLATRAYPITTWPLLLSSREAAGLLALPLGDVFLPGVSVGAARQLPPPVQMPTTGLILGMSNYPGMERRPIVLKTEDRLRHMALVAPTGSGKSWLLTQMMLQDIASGYGTIAIDPKGDLLTDILSRVSDKDAERVVVLDAGQRDQPIGLNILGGAHDEASRELLVDNVLGVFRSIWAETWGPRSDSLCRAVLTTLVNARGVDNSPLTLCELTPLLTESAFRRFVLAQPGLPDMVRDYWQRYNRLSDGEMRQTTAPLLHKAEAFTSRTAIRLMLGQSTGFDLRDIFRQRKTVLISLAKGTLGEETAKLLGSLLVSLLWQATLARVSVPVAQRRPVFAYIDEAADFMRLPVPLADMYRQARGLGLGVITATQYFAQMPQAIQAALLGTVRTQFSYAVEREDANLLSPRFAPLTADDLQGLLPYEAALRPCLDGTTRAPVTLTTLPLAAPVRDADELARRSRERYGRPRSEVEAALRARIQVTAERSTAGRRPRGGTA